MSGILDESHVFLNNPATTCDEALQFVADKAEELGIVYAGDAQKVLEGLKARESEGSTGMMSGFAIPHCKSAVVHEPSIVVVKFAGDVDWKTMDKTPVKVALALLIPDGEVGTEHLSILSKIAVMLMHEDFCKKVLDSEDAAEIVAAITDGLSE